MRTSHYSIFYNVVLVRKDNHYFYIFNQNDIKFEKKHFFAQLVE